MRIFDQEKDETLKNIILCLTLDEAKELKDCLNDIIKSKTQITHEHVNDQEYNHEITVTIYNDKNLGMYTPRLIKVIKCDT